MNNDSIQLQSEGPPNGPPSGQRSVSEMTHATTSTRGVPLTASWPAPVSRRARCAQQTTQLDAFDQAWSGFMHRYEALLRGYARVLGARDDELGPLVAAVAAGYLAVRAGSDAGLVESGLEAIDHLAWSVRRELCRLQRQDEGRRDRFETAEASMTLAHREAGPDWTDPKCREVWRRICLSRALLEIRRQSGEERFAAYERTVRQRRSDEAVAVELRTTASAVRAARIELRELIRVTFERIHANQTTGAKEAFPVRSPN